MDKISERPSAKRHIHEEQRATSGDYTTKSFFIQRHEDRIEIFEPYMSSADAVPVTTLVQSSFQLIS